MDILQNLLVRHEALKSKGLRLTDHDIHEWIGILEDLIVLHIETESEYDEFKIQLENLIGTKHIIMKEEDGGSDTVVKAKVKQLFMDETVKLAVINKTMKLAKGYQTPVEHYINLAKRVVK